MTRTTNYEIIAVGNIEMQAIQCTQVDNALNDHCGLIENIWLKAQEESGGELFNGMVLNFIKMNKRRGKTEILSHFIEYKNFFAQQRSSEIELGIKPIGVSGIIVLSDSYGREYVLFGKRASIVTEYPGLFELVPSGSIDKECADVNGTVDYKFKLLSEFIEETGLPKGYVKEINEFALILDNSHNVYDICCELLIRVPKETVAQRFKSNEYSAPLFVEINDLEKFIEMNISSIIPTSIATIRAYMRDGSDNKKKGGLVEDMVLAKPKNKANNDLPNDRPS